MNQSLITMAFILWASIKQPGALVGVPCSLLSSNIARLKLFCLYLFCDETRVNLMKKIGGCLCIPISTSLFVAEFCVQSAHLFSFLNFYTKRYSLHWFMWNNACPIFKRKLVAHCTLYNIIYIFFCFRKRLSLFFLYACILDPSRRITKHSDTCQLTPSVYLNIFMITIL